MAGSGLRGQRTLKRFDEQEVGVQEHRCGDCISFLWLLRQTTTNLWFKTSVADSQRGGQKPEIKVKGAVLPLGAPRESLFFAFPSS